MEKTEWHPAFCAAMRLELKDNPTLEFYDEYNLNVDPLRVAPFLYFIPASEKVFQIQWRSRAYTDNNLCKS